ncbi:MAG: ACP phosphodiesterase [Bacteroidales bacterium]
MNFLAHAYLSGAHESVLLGNFIADAVKGNHLNVFPGEVALGIRLHREIDTYTDRHPSFLESSHRIRHRYHKFSGIIVDIYYDHFLARHWSDYSGTPLPEYASAIHRLLIGNYTMLPSRSRRILPFLVSQNWLLGYRYMHGLRRVFLGMDRRTGYRSGMKHAVEDLEGNYEGLQADFKRFFPEMVHQVIGFLDKNDLPVGDLRVSSG